MGVSLAKIDTKEHANYINRALFCKCGRGIFGFDVLELRDRNVKVICEVCIEEREMRKKIKKASNRGYGYRKR